MLLNPVPRNRQELEVAFTFGTTFRIFFTKKNGDIRSMLRTRSALLIPEDKGSKKSLIET